MSTLCLVAVLSLVSQTPTTAEPPRLDASSEAALEASLWRVYESAPPSHSVPNKAHPLSLALDSLTIEGMTERDRASAAQGKWPDRVTALKHLDGMTYEQIIAAWHAREMRRRLEWKAKNMRAGVQTGVPPAPATYRFPANPYVNSAPTPSL